MSGNNPLHAAPEPASTKGVISSTKYDALKHAVQLVLPAIGTLYFALASIWGLPYSEEVIGSLAALAVFLGVVITFLSSAWGNTVADGTLDVTQDATGKKTFVLGLNADPETLENQDTVVFKVNKP